MYVWIDRKIDIETIYRLINISSGPPVVREPEGEQQCEDLHHCQRDNRRLQVIFF